MLVASDSTKGKDVKLDIVEVANLETHATPAFYYSGQSNDRILAEFQF